MPQSQTAALPRPQEEEETDKSKHAQSYEVSSIYLNGCWSNGYDKVMSTDGHVDNRLIALSPELIRSGLKWQNKRHIWNQRCMNKESLQHRNRLVRGGESGGNGSSQIYLLET